MQCRLCRAGGHHEIDIWTYDSHNAEFALSEKIFECIGVQVCDTTVNVLTPFHPGFAFLGEKRRRNHQNMSVLLRHDKRIFFIPRYVLHEKHQLFAGENQRSDGKVNRRRFS